MSEHWQPTATLKNLQARAHLLKKVRDFFAKRAVMEVETPLLCHTSVTDPFIESMPVLYEGHPGGKTSHFYLQTSPEYAMKRLLSAGSGAIFQIAKAFRQGEVGRFHNPEFTMVEWYRPDFNHHDLMREVDEFLQETIQTIPAKKMSFTELFQTRLNIDPHTVTLSELILCAKKNNIYIKEAISDKDTWLNLLMSHCIEPHLGKDRPCFIYDFPASLAALAKINPSNPPLAARFEVYFRGMELANGFHELQDANEQRDRFQKNLMQRKELGLPLLPIDELFLASLPHLPDCSGVALGIDRLLMLANNSNHIKEILSFDIERA